MIKVIKDSRFRNISEAQLDSHLGMGWTVAEESNNTNSKPKKAKKKPVEEIEETLAVEEPIAIETDTDATE